MRIGLCANDYERSQALQPQFVAGSIKDWFHRLVVPLVPQIVDNAHDLKLAHSIRALPAKAFAARALARPTHLGHGLIDNCGVGACADISLVEISARMQRDAHSPKKIAGPDPATVP